VSDASLTRDRTCSYTVSCVEHAITRPSVLLPATSALAQEIFPPCWKRQGEWSRRLQSEADGAAALNELVDKINLKPRGIELSINLPLPVDGTHGAAAMLPIAEGIEVAIRPDSLI
jgi:hypothetical protein